MKILYIHQYFITPNEPGGTRSYWLAKELIESGHEVIMITSSTKFDANLTISDIEGIKVYYIKENYDQSMSIIRRLWAFISFSIKSIKISFKIKNVDVVFATSTPLTVGIPALFLKFLKKIPYIFEVRDLWPEVPIQMGAIKNPILIFCAKTLEKIIYKNANHVIALSPGMADGVAKYVPRKKVTMIPNMSKIDEFWPRNLNFDLMSELGLDEKSFKVVHFGSLGLANGVESIIQSAKLLRNNSEIDFLFIGGGATEKRLKEECELNELSNVKFLGKFPMKVTSEIVNFCHVSIVSFLDIPILYTNSPNKLFDSLSAGKPIIVNSAGWTKDLVEENRCGYYVNPKDPTDLVSKILFLKDNSEVLKEMGRYSRIISEKVFDKSLLSKKLVKTIEGNV